MVWFLRHVRHLDEEEVERRGRGRGEQEEEDEGGEKRAVEGRGVGALYFTWMKWSKSPLYWSKSCSFFRNTAIRILAVTILAVMVLTISHHQDFSLFFF